MTDVSGTPMIFQQTCEHCHKFIRVGESWVPVQLPHGERYVHSYCDPVTLTRLLESFVDTDNPCSFDHHGACQSHACGSETGWCANAEALAFLRKVDK